MEQNPNCNFCTFQILRIPCTLKRCSSSTSHGSQNARTLQYIMFRTHFAGLKCFNVPINTHNASKVCPRCFIAIR